MLEREMLNNITVMSELLAQLKEKVEGLLNYESIEEYEDKLNKLDDTTSPIFDEYCSFTQKVETLIEYFEDSKEDEEEVNYND